MHQFKQPAVMIGTVLIVLGVAVVFMKLGFIEHIPLSRFWPVILIMIGLNKLLQAENGKARWDSTWLLLLGVWFQLVTLRMLGLTYRNSWPMVLIVWGVFLTGAALARKSHMTLAKENGNGN